MAYDCSSPGRKKKVKGDDPLKEANRACKEEEIQGMGLSICRRELLGLDNLDDFWPHGRTIDQAPTRQARVDPRMEANKGTE